jgi:nucleoid-associated protein YgaU
MNTSRYNIIKIKNNDMGKKVLKPVLYPSIPNSPDDTYIVAAPGTRLDVLAFTYYGNVNNWWIIAEANGIGKGTFTIKPGLQLRIPSNLDRILNNYTELNK